MDEQGSDQHGREAATQGLPRERSERPARVGERSEHDQAPGWSIAQCGMCSWVHADGSPLERLGHLMDHVRDVHNYGADVLS